MDIHWRNSMKPVRCFALDARAALPFVLVLLHLRLSTLGFAAFTTLVFYFLEIRGLSFVTALRAGRVWLVTRKRPNIKGSDRSRMVDFAFEPVPDAPIAEEVGAAAASAPPRKSTSAPAALPAKRLPAANQPAAPRTVRPAAATVRKKG